MNNVVVPANITSLGDMAFASCASLNKVTIEATVTTIPYRAFYSCVSLREVSILNNVTTIEEDAFGVCYELTDVYYSGTSEEKEQISIGTGNSYLEDSIWHYNTVHEHSYTAAVTAPTCTEGGYTTYTCTVCGDSYVADETAALGHTPGEAAKEHEVAPDCTNGGSYEIAVYCDICGAELSRETVTVPALGHTPGAPVIENAVDATCTVAGSYDSVVYCAVCGEELSRETVTGTKLPHTEEVVPGKAPTCTETGLTEGKHCSVCGEVLVAQEVVAALGHTEVVDAAVPAVYAFCALYAVRYAGDYLL